MYSNICDKYIHRPAIFLLLLLLLLLDRREPGPIRSVLLIIIGWLFGSLVTQFSQLAQLGTIKVEKPQSRIFEKDSWFGDIREKVSKLAQNQTLWYLSQKRLQRFFWFLAWS